MEKRTDNRALLRELAASENGVFTSALAQACGISKHALSHAAKTGLLERIAHGAYRVSSSADDGLDVLRAHYKLINPRKWMYERMRDFDGAALVGTTAAFMHGIGDFQIEPFFIAVPKRFNSRSESVCYPVMEIAPTDVVWKHGLPVATLDLTLATLVGMNEDPSNIANCFVDAIRRYGMTELDARALRRRLGDAAYGALVDGAQAVLARGYQIEEIDDMGHLAIVLEDGRA